MPVTPNHRAVITHTHARTQGCAEGEMRRSHSCEPHWYCSRQLPRRCLHHSLCENDMLGERSSDFPSSCINPEIYTGNSVEDYTHLNVHRNKTKPPFSRDTSRDSERRVSQEVLRNKYRFSSRGHLDDDHFDIQLT